MYYAQKVHATTRQNYVVKLKVIEWHNIAGML